MEKLKVSIMNLNLSAYQKVEFHQYRYGYAEEGNTLKITFISAYDNPFVEKHLTMILKEEDQEKLISIFRDNLDNDD